MGTSSSPQHHTPVGYFPRSLTAEQLLCEPLRRLGQPGIGDDLAELVDREPPEVALEQEDGVVAVPVRRREPRRVRVRDHGLLVLGRAQKASTSSYGSPVSGSNAS